MAGENAAPLWLAGEKAAPFRLAGEPNVLCGGGGGGIMVDTGDVDMCAETNKKKTVSFTCVILLFALQTAGFLFCDHSGRRFRRIRQLLPCKSIATELADSSESPCGMVAGLDALL